MNGWMKSLPVLLFVAVVGVVALQFRTIAQLRSELAEIRSQIADSEQPEPVVTRQPAQVRRVPRGPDLNTAQRVSQLESEVQELIRVADYLKRRGQIPPGEAEIDAARATFLDASQSDRNRLRALRTLRRNGGFSPELEQQAIAWLQSTTDTGMQESLLNELSGVTNAALRQPLISLASSPEADVREEAIDNLRRFMSDPQVEALLWNTLRNDPEDEVRDSAAAALERGPFTESRIAMLQQHGLNPQTPLEERLLAFRALERADADSSAVAAALAQLAQNTTDSDAKRTLFRAFDGREDPVLKLPLVTALQDANPFVREEAVDALSTFRSDPTVQEWLQYVAQNDSDPQVRREAFEALEDD